MGIGPFAAAPRGATPGLGRGFRGVAPVVAVRQLGWRRGDVLHRSARRTARLVLHAPLGKLQGVLIAQLRYGGGFGLGLRFGLQGYQAFGRFGHPYPCDKATQQDAKQSKEKGVVSRVILDRPLL